MQVEKYYFPFRDPSTGEISGYKVKTVGRKDQMYVIGDCHSIFGLYKFRNGGKRIVLTEGEEDKLAVDQANKSYYGEYYPCVSVGSASGVEKMLMRERETLLKFEEIIVWFDNDEPGKAAAARAARTLGYNKVKLVESDVKDACDKLRATGNSKEGAQKFMRLIWDAKPTSPASVIGSENTWDRFQEYLDMEFVPWAPFLGELNNKTFGRALGTISMFVAGCHRPDTEILMHDGSLKQVRFIRAGEFVAGEYGQPQEVLNVASGVDSMYRIRYATGEELVVNSKHIISLVYCMPDSKYKGIKQGDVVNVTVEDYLTWNKTKKHAFKQYLGPGVAGSEKKLPINPWLLGIWLGDGSEDCAALTNTDPEVWERVQKLCGENNWTLANSSKAITKRINGGLQSILRSEKLLGNKHIPEVYFQASTEQRLELLAGLLDSDGYLDHNSTTFEITQSRKHLLDQVARLCRGLGLRTRVTAKWSKQWSKYYYKLSISGETQTIPVVIKRKKARKSLSNRNFRHVGFSVEAIGKGPYCGLSLSGSHLYQTAIGVVTHNTGVGKSSFLREDAYHLWRTTDAKIGMCFLEEDIGETVSAILSIHMNKRVGLPSTKTTKEELRVAWEEVMGGGRFMLIDHQGAVSDNSLVDKLEYLILSGCQFIYLDHITIAVSDIDISDTNKAIDKLMSDLLKLLKQLS